MVNFLTTLNLQEYSPIFQEEGIDDLETLQEYSEDELKDLGLKGGHVKKIIKALHTSHITTDEQSTPDTTQPFTYPNNLNPNDMVTYLAHPWDEYIREEHPSVKLHWLVDTAEVVVRWVCALLLAEIRHANDNTLPDNIQKRFKENIERPTLGIWLNFVSELSQVKPAQTHLKGLFDIYANELHKDGLFPDDGDDKNSLLKLRNRIAHGGGTTLSQAQEYLEIYAPRLESLLLSVNNIMSHAKLYGNFNGTCYLLQGLQSTPVQCNINIDGPYINIDDTILSLWPLVEFDMVRQLDDNGILEEKRSLTPQTYLRTDKQGVQYIPMGVEESYSITNRQEEFEMIFGLNKKADKSTKIKQHEYHYNDFLMEARYLKEELIGRVDEIKTMKDWIKTVDTFDEEPDCRYIYGGPGLGKSMLMASVASDLSNDKNNNIFYYRFRGGDARNNKQTFIKLLRDSLISWSALSEICEEAEDLMTTDDMLKDLEVRIDKIKELPPFIKRVSQTEEIEVRPILRLFIDGLDEVLLHDRSMLDLIKSVQKQGVVTLIATRLENGAETLSESSWSQALVFRDEIDGLPQMSENDIRAMLLNGISKAQRKELIENDDLQGGSNSIVQAISKKADGLPLYIHLLINDLQNNRYSLKDTLRFPDGLNKYYYELVGRMGINDIDSYKAPLITLLSLTSEPIDTQAMALILDDIEDVEETEPLIKDVVLAVGTLLKQVTTKEETIGYTLYHQSFRDFIAKAENDEKHPLYRNLKNMKKALYRRAEQWRELPNSNLKNHLFRKATEYTLEWQENGLEVVKNRLTDLEYLLQRTEQLPATELGDLLKEYELIQSKLSQLEQKEFYAWSSFFRENLHLIASVDEELWRPNKSLFQLVYEDGDNSPLTKQAEKLLEENKIDFLWLKRRNRNKKFIRNGTLKVLKGHSTPVLGIEILTNGNIISYSEDGTLKLWNKNGMFISSVQGHTDKVLGIKTLDNKIISYSADGTLKLWSDELHELKVLTGHKNSVNGLQITNNLDLISWSYTKDLFAEQSDIVQEELDQWDQDEELRQESKHWDSFDDEYWDEYYQEQEDSYIIEDKNYFIWDKNGNDITPPIDYFFDSKVIKGAEILTNGNIILWTRSGYVLLDTSYNVLHRDNFEDIITCIKGLQDSTFLICYAESDGLDISNRNQYYCALHLYSETGKLLKKFELNDLARIKDVIELSSGDILVYGKAEDGFCKNTLFVFDISGKEKFRFTDYEEIMGVKELINGSIISYTENKAIIHSLFNSKEIELKLNGQSIRNIENIDDKYFLSYSSNNTFCLWTLDGNLYAVFQGHTAPVLGVKMLIDGQLISYSEDNTIRIWSYENKIETTTIGHKGPIESLLLMSDNNFLSLSKDSTWLWNSHKEVQIEVSGLKDIKGVQVIDENIYTYSIGIDEDELGRYEGFKFIAIWNHTTKSSDSMTFTEVTALYEDIEDILILSSGNTIVWSKKNLWLCSSSEEEKIELNAVQNEEYDPLLYLPGEFPGEEYLYHCSTLNGIYEINKKIIAWSSKETELTMWDLEGEYLGKVARHNSDVKGMCEIDENYTLSWDHYSLYIWDLSWNIIYEFDVSIDGIKYVKILDNGNILICSKYKLYIWDSNGKLITSKEHIREIVSIKVLNDEYIIIGDINSIWSWNINNKYLLLGYILSETGTLGFIENNSIVTKDNIPVVYDLLTLDEIKSEKNNYIEDIGSIKLHANILSRVTTDSVKRLEHQEEREAMVDENDSMTHSDSFGDLFKR